MQIIGRTDDGRLSSREEMDIVTMTQAELENLQNYSLSNPTGCTIGRKWRMMHRGVWYLCEYVESPKPDTVGILRKRIEIKKPVGETVKCAPEPRQFMFSLDWRSSYKSLWLGWWLITWTIERHPWRVRDLSVEFR